MGKIGIMGGTFNPIHIGHLVLAERILDDFEMDEIWFIPTGCSYMKRNLEVAEGLDRYNMVELAIADNDKMKILDIELKRSGHTYSYETLEELREQYPEDEFYFIFGADCLFTIENWKCPERIFANCKVIAAARNGADLREMDVKRKHLASCFGADITIYPFIHLEISSTDLRNRLQEGKSVKHLIPEQVIQYIKDNGLYGQKEGYEDK